MNGISYKIWSDFETNYQVTEEKNEDGVKIYRFSFDYDQECSQKDREIEISYTFPHIEMTGSWYPGSAFDRAIDAEWASPKESMTARFAPVMCFYNGDAENQHTIAWSEINQKVELQYGVYEEDGTMLCATRIYLTRQTAPEHYEIVLRDVTTKKPYWEVLRDTVDWWEEEKKLNYLVAPAAARESLYSFWYSFHQNIYEKEVEAECQRAADMGFSAIILDDGWQTLDIQRGYAYCGDWEMSPVKFPDFAAHVKRVQAMGLKYILWFSVPFVGVHSKAYQRFKDKMLYMCNDKWGVIDIRYPECREYLLNIYEKAIVEWGLDGFKLDFIDKFQLRPESPAYNEGMDYLDVQDALTALLTEVNTRLRSKKPDLLIEFRQDYVGPQVQTFGNMLRVGDCPNSGLTNRVGIADLRLLSKSVAIHSDMLMWHKDEKVEDAALQILSCIFGTLQFSVKLDTLTEEMKKMAEFWMGFMGKHMDLLQSTIIRPLEPENLYPEISVCDGNEAVVAHYSKGRILNLTSESEKLYYVYAVKEDNVVVRNAEGLTREYEIFNCMGESVETGHIDGTKFTEITVPCAGLVVFK